MKTIKFFMSAIAAVALTAGLTLAGGLLGLILAWTTVYLSREWIFTLLNDCVGDTEIPGRSFKEYIAEKSYAPVIEAELAAKAAKEA